MTLPKAAMSSPGPGPGRLPQLSRAASTASPPPGPAPPGSEHSARRCPGSRCSGWIPGRGQPLPSLSPLSRLGGEEAPERGSIFPWLAGAGEEPPPPAEKEGELRSTGVGRGGNGVGSPASLCFPSPFPSASFARAAGGASRAGAGRGRPSCVCWAGLGCAPRGLVSQAPGL